MLLYPSYKQQTEARAVNNLPKTAQENCTEQRTKLKDVKRFLFHSQKEEIEVLLQVLI